MARLHRPNDKNLPYFAYDAFKPEQVAFPIIAHFVDHIERFEIDYYELKHRNGIPMVVEEISILMANHCFKDEYTGIDVKVSVLRNTIIVRTRCGGEMFNPVTWFANEEETDSDSEELFGMRMVDKMANDIRYTQLFDLNNVIVTMEGHS